MQCPSCHREIDGKKVEPGKFTKNPKLRKAGIAQWCKDCLKDVPEEIQVDLETRPDYFIEQARLEAKHEKFREVNNRKIGFEDHLTVVKTNPSGVQPRGRWL